MFLFAHAGEAHSTDTEAALHNLLMDWYLQIPLFLLALAAIAWLTYMVTRRSLSKTTLTLTALLFVIGISTYKLVPAISVISLTLGFALALVQVLLPLKHKSAPKQPD